MKKILLGLLIFCSCNNPTENINCKKINLKEADFMKTDFSFLPKDVQDTIIRLATVGKNIDTVLSLQKGITYTYFNPGDNKGYMEQIRKDKDMHIINGKCYEFLLYAKPYIIYNDKIFVLCKV